MDVLMDREFIECVFSISIISLFFGFISYLVSSGMYDEIVNRDRESLKPIMLILLFLSVFSFVLLSQINQK